MPIKKTHSLEIKHLLCCFTVGLNSLLYILHCILCNYSQLHLKVIMLYDNIKSHVYSFPYKPKIQNWFLFKWKSMCYRWRSNLRASGHPPEYNLTADTIEVQHPIWGTLYASYWFKAFHVRVLIQSDMTKAFWQAVDCRWLTPLFSLFSNKLLCDEQELKCWINQLLESGLEQNFNAHWSVWSHWVTESEITSTVKGSIAVGGWMWTGFNCSTPLYLYHKWEEALIQSSHTSAVAHLNLWFYAIGKVR